MPHTHQKPEVKKRGPPSQVAQAAQAARAQPERESKRRKIAHSTKHIVLDFEGAFGELELAARHLALVNEWTKTLKLDEAERTNIYREQMKVLIPYSLKSKRLLETLALLQQSEFFDSVLILVSHGDEREKRHVVDKILRDLDLQHKFLTVQQEGEEGGQALYSVQFPFTDLLFITWHKPLLLIKNKDTQHVWHIGLQHQDAPLEAFASEKVARAAFFNMLEEVHNIPQEEIEKAKEEFKVAVDAAFNAHIGNEPDEMLATPDEARDSMLMALGTKDCDVDSDCASGRKCAGRICHTYV